MENPNYKIENIDRKYLDNMQKNQFKEGIAKVRNSLLEIEKDFIELKDRELKDRELKIKWRDRRAIFKPIIVSVNDMDKFEQKEMNKIKPTKNTWYDWLINYIPEHIINIAVGFQDEIISLFNTNTPKQIMCERVKKLSRPKIPNKIKRIINLFILKKKTIKL